MAQFGKFDWNLKCSIAGNVLHKTSSGIGSSTLSTAKNLINCTALTYTTETAIGFMLCYNKLFMSYIGLVISGLIFIISSIFCVYGSTIEHAYLKDESYFEYVWFIAMDWVLVCGAGVALCICLPVLIVCSYFNLL